MHRNAIVTAALVVSFLALNVLPTSVIGHGYMTLLFKSYINNDGRCSDGTFCDPVGVLDIRQTPCDPYFTFVADKTAPGGNGLFNYQTSVHWDVDTVNFGSNFGDLANPVTIPMNYNDNPGTMQFRVTAMDKDTETADDHMDTFSASLTARADGIKRDLEMQSPPMMSRLQVQYWYSCHANYYGLDCNKFCAPHNDDVSGHYTCDSSGNRVCMAGWIGDTCTQPHPCISKPCMNGGTCTNVGGAASCSCPHGITGSRCELDVNECAETSPCVNGGTCVNSLGGFSCSCPARLTGTRCEVDVNECIVASPCENGGTCANSFGSFSCNCTELFTGRLCDHDVNECHERSPCDNGGTCVNSFGNFSCYCQPGFTGRHCNEDVNECTVTSPCVNNGTCVNSPGNYSCMCQLQFSGRHCESRRCDAVVCVNGGTCEVATDGATRCRCRAGFNGSRCEVPDDPRDCRRSGCENGGSCEATEVVLHQCRCASGFSGSTCGQASMEHGSSNVVEVSIGSAVGAIVLVGAIIGIVVGVLVHRGVIESCRSGGSASDELSHGAENATYMDPTEDVYEPAVDEAITNSSYGAAASSGQNVNHEDIYLQVE